MTTNLFSGLFDTAFTVVIDPGTFLLCLGTALLAGLLLCLSAQWHASGSDSFSLTLALLPATVCVVIMMVNGNVGTGVAVAGTFSLIRFRSAPGNGREISAIFIAMGSGLLAGMGYLAYCLLFTVVLSVMMMLYTWASQKRKPLIRRQLRISIPENLDYVGLFDPVLASYASDYALRQVKTSNMGSLFRLTYDVTLPNPRQEKQLLDEVRCLNGNLEITMSYQETNETDSRL